MTLTEEQRGTVAFDLEAARASIAHYRIENPSNVDTESALKELVDQANLAEDAIAEIERLRAYLEQSERVIEAGLDVIKAQAIQIKALEDVLAEYQRLGKIISESVIPCLTVHGNCDQCRPKTKAACEAIAAIHKGKIGSGGGA